VLELIHRFAREQPLHRHVSKLTDSLVQQLEDSEKWKKANPLEPGSTLKRSRKAMDPAKEEQQTAALARRMRERLIVNFLKQVILFGVELVKEDVQRQLLRSYSRLENRSKILQPKSLHYLLQLFSEGDVPKMLSLFVEQERQRSKNREASLDEEMLADEEHRKPMTKAQMQLDKVMRDIEKIKSTKTEAKDRRVLEEELRKVKDDQLKATAQKKVELRLLEHGVLQVPKKARGVSNERRLDKDGSPIEVRLIKARDVEEELSEINASKEELRLSLVPMDDRPAKKAVLKQLKEFQLFDLTLEEQKDQEGVRYFVKKQLKVLKYIFNKYSNSTGPINTVQQTFEELQSKTKLMVVGEAMKMLKDFQISSL
jgi:hypothetical protein